MPTFRLSCFTSPTILSSIDPSLLRSFLIRFREYLEARSFQIPTRDAFDESDYAALIRILHSPSAQTPSEMTQALWHIDDMSSDQGREALLLAASKNGIAIPEPDRLTPSDLAIHIWLHDPSVLRHANAERVVTKVKSFEYFRNRNIEPPELKTPTEETIQTIQAAMDDFNRRRRRGGGAVVSVHPIGDELAFLMKRGDRHRVRSSRHHLPHPPKARCR